MTLYNLDTRRHWTSTVAIGRRMPDSADPFVGGGGGGADVSHDRWELGNLGSGVRYRTEFQGICGESQTCWANRNLKHAGGCRISFQAFGTIGPHTKKTTLK